MQENDTGPKMTGACDMAPHQILINANIKVSTMNIYEISTTNIKSSK